MEDLNEDGNILDELKSHFKNFNPGMIEILYETNNKDLSKTIDALIENENVMETASKKEEIKQNENVNNKEDNKEDDDDDNFFIFNENKNNIKEKEKEGNNININQEENNANIEDEKIDDNLLNFLIELAPFNTAEEIEQKIIDFNFDIDKVISSLIEDYKPDESIKEKNNIDNYSNKFNELKSSLNKKGRGNKKDKVKYRKYDEYKVLEFLEKNKNKQRIDLHGFKLSESMIIVKKKIEEMENLVKTIKCEKLLIIVTGRGNHSPGNKPVLRPNILRWLKRNNYSVNEKDPGALYVLIKYSNI